MNATEKSIVQQFEYWNNAVMPAALDPAAVSESLHQQTFWQGRGGAVTHAISGIDIALWDIFGKVTQQPISRLLGGRHRERIKPYGSLLMDEPVKLCPKLEDGNLSTLDFCILRLSKD